MPSTVLFPPSLSNYQPAAAWTGNSITEKNNTIRIPIDFANFMNVDIDKLTAHITIRNQITGENVIPNGYYVSNQTSSENGHRFGINGISVFRNIIKDSSGYHIEVSTQDIRPEKLFSDTNYLLQVRVTEVSRDISPTTTMNEMSQWLNDHASDFSEWSIQTRIRWVGKPSIYNSITNYGDTLMASFNFIPEKSKEKMENYIVSVYQSPSATDKTNSILIERSEKIYTKFLQNQYSGEYIVKQALDSNYFYYFGIDVETTNGYKLNYVDDTGTQIIPEEPADMELIDAQDKGKDEEEGRFHLKFKIKGFGESESATLNRGVFLIRRTSHESDFKLWENIYQFEISKDDPAFGHWVDFYDYSLESGFFYKYSIIMIKGYSDNIEYGTIQKSLKMKKNEESEEDAIICREFEHSYLLGPNGVQLKLPYNLKIGSFNYNIKDTKQETLGSQYPFITRNGNSKYRSFSIDGRIATQMDENEIFIHKRDYLKGGSALYGEDFKTNPKYHFRTIEREFRKKVIDFLQDDNVKLFKSPTEGNIIIKLTGVTFSADEALGRAIYDFSGSADEICDFNVTNCDYYGLITNQLNEDDKWHYNESDKSFGVINIIHNLSYADGVLTIS